MAKIDPLERFRRHFTTGEPDACWEWGGGRGAGGYGTFAISCAGKRGMATSAHRAHWILLNGEIPPGMLVCHSCDNPPCVNPAHLFLGTRKDNTLDMMRKGRGGHHKIKGSANPISKLTDFDVMEIRRRVFLMGHRQRDIARDLGVSQPAISYVINGKTWR